MEEVGWLARLVCQIRTSSSLSRPKINGIVLRIFILALAICYALPLLYIYLPFSPLIHHEGSNSITRSPARTMVLPDHTILLFQGDMNKGNMQ